MFLGIYSLTIILIGQIQYVWLSESGTWNYGSDGPDAWIHEYPQCAGILQSPVNILSYRAIYNNRLADFNFNNYDTNLLWNATNNGHTISVNQIGNKSIQPYLTGSDFDPDEKFILSQFHFHWGQNIYQGSEHHIDDVKFPLELHLVHQSLKSAKIAVLAFLFQISEQNNANLNDLVQLVGEDIVDYSFNVTSLALSSILPDLNEANKMGYYRYIGSLTTPPCTEGVIWTIFRLKVNISASQMANFYENQVHYNFRDVQTLNSRILFVSSEANVCAPSSINILLIVLNLCFYGNEKIWS